QGDRFGRAWVLRLLLGKVSLSSLQRLVGPVPDLELLYRAVREGGCKSRKKALVVLGFLRHAPPRTIARTLKVDRKTVLRYWEVYRTHGAKKLLARGTRKARKARDERTRAAVLALLHAPPSTHNINRTTWKMADLRQVLKGQGVSLSAGTVRKIIRATGFKWRKARIALTSNDPQYREKVARITSILSGLGPKERFFSVDEF